MEDVPDLSPFSTWDAWLATRPASGDQFSDGVAGALRNPDFPLEQFDFGSQGNRDGLRRLFDEFEAATEGQPVHGRPGFFERPFSAE